MIFYSDFHSKIYNYADDNTLSYSNYDQSILRKILTEDCIKAMRWFKFNNMKANASKFQVMYLSRNSDINRESITINKRALRVDTNKGHLSYEELCE